MQVGHAFATDFDCHRGIYVQDTQSPGRYVVTGCGERVVYECLNTMCAIQTRRHETPVPAPPSNLDARREEPAKVAVQTHGDQEVIKLELVLDAKSTLRLTGAPRERADIVQLKLLRQNRSEDVDECQLGMMIDGQIAQLPKAVGSRDGDTLTHRVQLGRDLVGELAAASKLSVRVCDERWGLEPEQVSRVREFVDRFQEDVAWSGGPGASAAASMPPPIGGWPAWGVVGSLPPSAGGAALDAPALFKKLSASVFQLEATRADGISQGSAVAISPTELVTNCHVVQGSAKLTLRQDKKSWIAHATRADATHDRCVITASGVTLKPVAGVRTYDSLEVGETVYTLGSPVGLELTLASGIVSGRRDENNLHLIQTTAPISPGSSGGGLFDAHGNLVGVTTLVLAGRERLNQALNFAIPADSFWQP